MTELPQDNPINRARLADLPTKEIEDFVAGLQKRRMKAQEIYLQAQEAMKLEQENKDAAHLAKRLEQFEKKYTTVDNGLQTLEKYAKEIIGLRLALGHQL
jgi:DNA-binding transcriptional MerR regulator